MPAAMRPGSSTSVRVGPPSPAASMMITAPMIGVSEDRRERREAARGGRHERDPVRAPRRTDLIVSIPSPLPSASRGAPDRARRRARSPRWPPASRRELDRLDRCAAQSGGRTVAAVAGQPGDRVGDRDAGKRQDRDRPPGRRTSKPRARGSSRYTQSWSPVTTSRNSQPTTETTMPMMPATTSSPMYSRLRMSAAGSIGSADSGARSWDWRHPLQPLPRHGHLLADAGGAADRPQQPRRRLRLGRRVRRRLSGLLRHPATRLRAASTDPPRQRLQHRGLRQVAPDPRRSAGSGRTVRPLAHGLGLRVLLRLPRRRRRAVGHGRSPRTRRSSGSIPKYGDEENPYYLPDAMADKTIEWLHGIRAQDARKPFFAYFSTGCSHAPHHVAESGRPSTRASSTRAGTDCASRRSPARRRSVSCRPMRS